MHATAYNLNGQLKDLKMRRIQEGTAIYFIGEVGISGTEILVFDIDATPRGGADATPCSSNASSSPTESHADAKKTLRNRFRMY